jgi:hypothetical protein
VCKQFKTGEHGTRLHVASVFACKYIILRVTVDTPKSQHLLTAQALLATGALAI